MISRRKRRKNPFPSSIERIPDYTFDEDIRELKQVYKAYEKMVEYLELCENDQDFKDLMKDRKTRLDILDNFSLISGGAEDIKLGINNTLNKMIKLADYLAIKYGLEI